MELLTKNIVSEYIDGLIGISKQLEGDYWTKEHYSSDLNRKWELSYCEIKDKELLGFMIVSDKGESHHLHRIAIDEKHKGKGLGREFMNIFMENARIHQSHAYSQD